MSDLGRQPKIPVGGQLGSAKKKSIKAQSIASEKESANFLEGHRQPMSGAMEGRKGDVSLKKFLLDEKDTSDVSAIMVKRADLVKIDQEATGENKVPGLIIGFNKIADGVSRKWVVIPIEAFKAMLDASLDDLL